MASKNKKTVTKYADPVTGTYIDVTKDLQAPVEKSPASAFGVTEAEYQDYPKAVKESLERPESAVDQCNEEINQNYPWCLPSITTPQRAILCELIRIRKALEAK